MFGLSIVIVREGQAGLLFENGRFVSVLQPGRYFVVDLPWCRRDVQRVDLRREILQIQGQEMLTADALSVRLNVVAEYRVTDAPLAVNSVARFQVALYTTLQLLLREEVQSRTLDALLADRSALSGALLERGQPQAAAIGLELIGVGVKDVILPGEVKRMLAQEVEAQRAGRAALVAAREEVAATRARANTAQILQSNPVLLRLREIEALARVGEGDGNTVVIALPPEQLAAGLAAARQGE